MPSLTQSAPTGRRAVFTPGIEKTRSYMLKAQRSGIRYGNFDNAHSLPHVGRSHVAGQHFVPFFKNKQVYQKVQEWFESWQPWQQRILLCGLTNRSSTVVLESLATTLEPLFHRDFTLELRYVYPTTPFKAAAATEKLAKTKVKHDKKKTGAQSRNSKCKDTQTPKTPSTKKCSTQGIRTVVNGEETQRSDDLDTDQPVDVREILKEVDKEKVSDHKDQTQIPENVSLPPTPSTPTHTSQTGLSQTLIHDEQFHKGVNKLAEQMAANILSEVGVASAKQTKTVEDVASELVGKAVGEALAFVRGQRGSSQRKASLTDALGNIILDQSEHSGNKTTQESAQESKKQLCTSHEKDNLVPGQIESHPPDPSYQDLESRLRDQLLKSQMSRSASILQLIPDDPEQPASQHHNPWASRTVPGSYGEHSCDLISCEHRHRSAVPLRHIKSADFFLGGYHSKLGPMQAELRTGQVNRPPHVSDLYLPLQNMYKHSKWYGDVPAAGKTFVQPQSSALNRQFTTQIKQLWQWMETWEDHEKLSLLKELLKLCTTPLLSYLTQCVCLRLQERVDINWLPDRLLLYIFSQMSFDDIYSCSQVCRRWRYLCAVDQLWMVKCHELGAELGITELPGLVVYSNHRQQDIDWKLAYLELQRIAADAMNSVPLPSKLSTQGSTPPGMKKTDKGFVPLEPEEEEARISRELYKTMHTTLPEIYSRLLTVFTHNIKPFVAEVLCKYLSASLTPRKGLAAELARESDRLKRGTSEGLPKALARNRRRREPEQSETNLSQDDATASTSSLYRKSPSLVGVSTSGVRSLDGTLASKIQDTDTNRTSPRLLVRPQHLKPALKANSTTTKSKSPAASSQQPSTQAAGISTNQNLAESMPLQPLVHRSKRPQDEEGEVALDIRPKLLQATDLLGKSTSSCDLKWRGQNQVKDTRRRSAERYAGAVKAVKRVRKLQGHMDGVLCLQFAKRRLITGSMDRSARIWDIRSGRSLHKFYGHKGGVTCLVFDADILYTGSWDTAIMVWDLVYFTRKAVLSGHRSSVSCLKLTKKYLLSGSHDGTVRVWHRLSLTLEKTLCGHRSGILCMDTDGEVVVTGSSDKTIRVTDIESEECLRELTGSLEPVHRLLLKTDLIISSDSKGRVLFWDRQTGSVEAAIQAHQSQINSLAFHDGRFFTAANDMMIKEWDLVTMTPVRSLQGHKAAVQDFKVSAERMVSCDSSGQVRVWDFEVTPGQASDVCDFMNTKVVNESGD